LIGHGRIGVKHDQVLLPQLRGDASIDPVQFALALDDEVRRAGVLGDPVELNRHAQHAAATYGVGFAPYFLALALWVGAMIVYMVLRPLNRRYVMSGAPAYRVALTGLLPAVAIGFVQATLLFAVVRFGLGLSPVHPMLTWGLLLLTAAAFAAII